MFFEIINTYCLFKTLYLSKHPHWFSSSLKKLIFDKKKNCSKNIQSPTTINYNKFSNLYA